MSSGNEGFRCTFTVEPAGDYAFWMEVADSSETLIDTVSINAVAGTVSVDLEPAEIAHWPDPARLTIVYPDGIKRDRMLDDESDIDFERLDVIDNPNGPEPSLAEFGGVLSGSTHTFTVLNGRPDHRYDLLFNNTDTTQAVLYNPAGTTITRSGLPVDGQQYPLAVAEWPDGDTSNIEFYTGTVTAFTAESTSGSALPTTGMSQFVISSSNVSEGNYDGTDWAVGIGSLVSKFWEPNGTDVASVTSVAGKRALCVRLDGTRSPSTRVGAGADITPVTSYKFTQKVYFDPDFEWGGSQEGGKLGFGLGGGSLPSSGLAQQDGFTSRFMWRTSGELEAYVYSATTSGYGDGIAEGYGLGVFAPRGQWFELSMEVVMNSSGGVADGTLRCWVDGVLRLERTDMEWFGTGTPQIDTLLHFTFHGGDDSTWTPNRVNRVYFGEIFFGAGTYSITAPTGLHWTQYAGDGAGSSVTPSGANYTIVNEDGFAEGFAAQLTPSAEPHVQFFIQGDPAEFVIFLVTSVNGANKFSSIRFSDLSAYANPSGGSVRLDADPTSGITVSIDVVALLAQKGFARGTTAEINVRGNCTIGEPVFGIFSPLTAIYAPAVEPLTAGIYQVAPNDASYLPAYPTHSPFNSDGSLFVMGRTYRNAYAYPGTWDDDGYSLFDSATVKPASDAGGYPAEVAQLPFSRDPVWSNTNPNIIYGVRFSGSGSYSYFSPDGAPSKGCQLVRCNVSDVNNITVEVLYSSSSFFWIGANKYGLSADDRYLVISENSANPRVFDTQTDTMGPVLSGVPVVSANSGPLIGVSPSGNYLITRETISGTNQYVRYNRDGTGRQQLETTGANHADFGYDHNGNEIICSVGNPVNAIQIANISGGRGVFSALSTAAAYGHMAYTGTPGKFMITSRRSGDNGLYVIDTADGSNALANSLKVVDLPSYNITGGSHRDYHGSPSLTGDRALYMTHASSSDFNNYGVALVAW